MAEIGPAGPLPRDEDLLAALEQAVENVFSTMVSSFETTALFRGALPEEQVDAQGEVDLVLGDASGVRVHIDREAVVEFRGVLDGRLALRCSSAGALDIARGLLMLEDDAALAVEDVNDALKECANMLTGHVKTRVLDPHGAISMSVPFVKGAARDPIGPSCGSLIYRLQQGTISLELWRRSAPLGPLPG